MLPVCQREHLCRDQPAVIPGNIDLQPSARTQAFDRPCLPSLGQRRQQSDLIIMTLQEQLSHAGGGAEITVDLEDASVPRRMRVKQIGAASDTAAAHVAFAEEIIEQGDYQGATGELLRALALQPASKEARSKLAAAYANLGQNDRAVLEYKKLLLAFPDEWAAHISLGKILLNLGKASDAAEQFKLALILDPGSQEARRGLQSADHPAHQR